MLFGMCFAPDCGRVLIACRDDQASLWDWQSGHLVSNLRQGQKRCSSQKGKVPDRSCEVSLVVDFSSQSYGPDSKRPIFGRRPLGR